ncbi:hypothetical protein A3A93_01775 [Candidatus Roizmanbacteria bacterium RIFCSPLOWO2_01_FULL_38_12]|uniref:RNA polymerase sigma-70 region 2 domain-containing protein n=1 Tax=Candidatus Roizmanbacteria bacterium RIFCSPLOWO2_01_FULL_38_12 TaxID=1802061 RepID=A0A1F7IY99_9BACT|nr:MAG: hypothetical protein A2861_02220 [Candidatus Roizmanbacteria bacterium RIFCSPHIGHO2_01_FULL_38_15]OGK34517.1 MAG: hypothetical protein A3F59_04305 [Candidatus Roizmanbacteria bacterium RIFCSPHIGHO2_12_FULL_38_13]OGK48346.1 MAG: hypothetical protein A3A93_01775 [Candidatus Roizmanbacteria bacterium RIFCSPLOWO2_01_FULL_38_12]
MKRDIDYPLITKIVNRNERGLYQLFQKYHSPVYNFVYKQLKDKAIADELTQDIFLSVIESLRDFRYQCSLKTFIFTIARNKIIDHFRKKKIKRILFSALPQFVVEGLNSVMIDDELEKKQIQQNIEDTFHKLPRDYQLILRLKYIEDRSVRSIAKRLVRTFKSTESLLFRARSAFKQIYDSIS